MRVRIFLLITAALTFALILVTAGVFAVAMAARLGSSEAWSRWADVGDAFGVLNGLLSGLAFAALIATLWIQFRELGLQRTELRMQRDAIERSGTELRRSADADLRMLHIELLKMSIGDPLLARVWPDPVVGDDEDHRRQLLYANLIFQNVSLSMLVSEYTDDQIRETVRYMFDSEVMREYWAMSAPARRRTQAPNTGPWRVARIGDEVIREYEAGAGGGGQESTT